MVFCVGALITANNFLGSTTFPKRESAHKNAQIVIGAPTIGLGACSSAANKHPVAGNDSKAAGGN